MSHDNDLPSARRQWSEGEEARYWRGRAGEVRKVGQLFGDPDARAKLEEIARHYEQMAEELEEPQSALPWASSLEVSE